MLLKTRIIILSLILPLAFVPKAYSQHIYPQDADRYASPVPGEQAIGRWNITISTPNGHNAAWLEIEKYGSLPLFGTFLVGSTPQPISKIIFLPKSQKYSFTIPPHLHMEFRLKNKNRLVGWMAYSNGSKLHWTATRAPQLKREAPPEWGKPIHLLKNGLAAWNIPGNAGQTIKGWTFRDETLIKTKGGRNIITKQKFEDFKLHIEFRYANHSNSGIYLRGRYEVQVLDSYGAHPESHQLGGIYGYITPTMNAAKKPGQWQTFDITLIGRMVTVVLNGKKIICHRPIPGITGGALNSHEDQPGPIMLQGGETGRVEYRNIIITPAK